MKNIDIYNIANELEKLIHSDIKVNVNVGFKLRRNAKAIKNIVEAYIDTRNSIIEKNGKFNEEKQTFEMSTDCVEGVKELQELDNIEVTLDGIEKVALADIEKLELPLNTLDAIEFMLGE